jgi:dolichol-phosphate mannosyltransferase
MLSVVMPVFNEAQAIEGVVREWLSAFKGLDVPWTFNIVNDGSTDATAVVLDRLSAECSSIKIQHQKNAGHGKACLSGYQKALGEKSQWIFQIDSDGQCDPSYFHTFWEARQKHAVQLGHRVRRDDGWARVVISSAMRLMIFVVGGTQVLDANVPYRLMRADRLEQALKAMPTPPPELANAILSVLLVQDNAVHWVPIHFRGRQGGNPSTRWWGFIDKGRRFCRDLRRLPRRQAA